MTRYRLGVDIGGTFTDIVLFDKKTGRYSTEKILTTTDNLARGVLNGILRLIDDLSEVDFFVHGTTSGLNAFLERKGAKMALIVTKGFRDIYEIGRANRPEIYNIQYRQPEPLIKRRHIFEVEERILVDGSVDIPLNVESLEQVITQITKKDFDSVSVCLLHSYKNPDHEKQIKEIIQKKIPGMSVSLSHEIVREWREYERTSTTVINAYIAPIVENYLAELEKEIKDKKLIGNLYIMQSNGGVMTSEIARNNPIQTLMSGPVGGTMGSIQLGKITDNQNLICIDMGGTSFDVSMVINGEPDVTSEANLEGFPIMTPMVNIHTIGAGGGSIAWIEGGGLRVGPKSAGANPGPACYGKGGTQATVTDANLILGRIDPEGFLGGNMKLDQDAAYKAIERISNKLGLSVSETAEGICDIANAKMADAIRTLTISKGIDPRDFALVAFGGAGPMHAVLIAEHLGINKVLVPTVAGTFSAWGMLQTDIRHDNVRTFVSLLHESNHSKMNSLFKEMEIETADVLGQQNIFEENMKFTRLADLRYVGQEYTVTVPCSSEEVNEQTIEQLTHLFHERHLKIYGHNNPEGIVEVVNLRVIGYGRLEKDEKLEIGEKTKDDIEPIKLKAVIWNGEEKQTPVYSINDLAYGHVIYGPTVIESPSSTIVVPESYKVKVDRIGNLEITKGGK